MIDGYFINPEGNVGHPVVYTHIHLHITNKQVVYFDVVACSVGFHCIAILQVLFFAF